MTDAKKAAKAAPAQVEAEGAGATGAPATSPVPAEQLVAARSADVAETATSEHRKVFVIPKNPLVGDDYGDETHAANIDAMRQAMILQGLRPTEDGRFVGAEDHPDGQSVCLTYACACVPAALATPEQNVVAVTVDDQHALEAKTNG